MLKSCKSLHGLRLLQEQRHMFVISVDAVAKLGMLVQRMAEAVDIRFLGFDEHPVLRALESVLFERLLDHSVFLLLLVDLRLQA